MNAPEQPFPQDPDGRDQSRAGAALARILPDDRLPAPAYPTIGQELQPEEEGLDLRALWQVIVKRRWTIIAVMLVVVAAAVTATLLATPIYRATLTLQIDAEEIKVVKIDTPTAADAGSGQEYLQTQYALLKSRSLAQRVVEQMGLNAPPDPNAAAPQSGLEMARAWLASWLRPGGPDPDAQELPAGTTGQTVEQLRLERAINDLLGNLTVAPIRNSRLVGVSYDSPDPVLAAKVLNNLAKTYINLSLERRFDATTYARNFLQERLAQVKTKLEESERELLDYASREQIVAIDQKENVIARSLEEANKAAAEATQRRIAAESIYRQLATTGSQGLPRVLDNPIIQELKQKRGELESQYRDVVSKGELDRLNSMLDKEIANIRAAITADYETAKAEETMQLANLAQIKKDLLALQGRSIQLNILRREADTNRQLYDSLLQRYKEVGVTAGIGINNLSVVDEAKVPSSVFKPNLRQNVAIALVLGVLAGVGLAFLFERLDDSFRRPEDLERILDLPMLGVVPKLATPRGDDRAMALIGHDDQRSFFAEAYRSVRTALQFSTARGVPRLLTVTSAISGEGKSTTALSLAIQFAQTGKQTLLIEADLRKPSLHKALRLDNETGLTNYLAGGDLLPADITRPSHIPNLFAIPSGPLPPNPAELLASPRMAELLELAAERFDQVILDSPPLLGLADAVIIGNLCEGTLITVEMGATPRGYVLGAVKRLRAARVPLVGTLMTKMEAGNRGYGYYYRSYYYYYHSGYYSDPTARKLS